MALFCDEIKLPDLDKYGEREGKGTGRGRRREDKRERVGKTGEGEGREGGKRVREKVRKEETINFNIFPVVRYSEILVSDC